MTTREAQQQAYTQLQQLYEAREASNIADWIMEHITGRPRVDRLVSYNTQLTNEQQDRLADILRQASTNKPIQYILGEAWFAGMKFFVNGSVLIPRPETEELVDWVITEVKTGKNSNIQLLDIGTGSGCIPVSLKKSLPGSSITTIDISDGALAVAKENAERLGAAIQFRSIDFLDESLWADFLLYDLIVSNPPYIKESESPAMSANVLQFEPHLALFVPDEDALLFYRKIAKFGKTHLNTGGMIFLEINEALGKEVTELFTRQGYSVTLKKDLQGKDRMIMANMI